MLFETIYRKAALCREFEKETFNRLKDKSIKVPTYLSAGQEYIPATIASFLEINNIVNRQIFIQHRGHSTYLSFNGNLDQLILELLGDSKGCSFGMGGSASIQSIEQNIIGHDGLMGSHGPIAVGMCYANKIPTIVFIGDAAAEEDYFLAALGWAVTKNLPILFVVEDNNLSILTEKRIRRSWDMHSVALGFGMEAYNIKDDPVEIINCLNNLFKKPLLLNINTNRMFWQAGAGIDDNKIFCRHTEFGKTLNKNFVTKTNVECETLVKTKWEHHLNH